MRISAMLVLFSAWACCNAGERNSLPALDSFVVRTGPGAAEQSGWQAVRGRGTDYSVSRDSSLPALHAVSIGGNASIGKRILYAVADFPLLSWSWKIITLPRDGCETIARKNDSAAGIYVSYRHGLVRKYLKYVWSTTLPKGSTLRSPFSPLTKIIVMESGAARIGKWVNERVNIRSDIKRCFDDEPARIDGFGIMTDADNTESTAEAWYAGISVSSDSH
jgi:hypothetical protein